MKDRKPKAATPKPYISPEVQAKIDAKSSHPRHQ